MRAGLGPRSLRFVPPEFPRDPYVRTVVEPQARANRLALAPDDGSGRLALIHRFPGRDLSEIRSLHEPNGLFDPPVDHTVTLTVDRTPLLRPQLVTTPPAGAKAGWLYVRLDGTTLLLRRTSVAPGPHDLGPLDFDAALMQLDPTRSHDLRVGVAYGSTPRLADASGYELRWEVGAAPGGGVPRLEVVDPPTPWHLYVFPNGSRAEAAEDISPVLRTR